ncbi:MAG: hypothetical protein ACRD0V_11685, partial [Acidimicrobiales bacterium]
MVAGLVGGGIGLALVTGVGPAPSFLAAASGGNTNGDSSTSTSAPPAPSGNQVVDAAGAGTLTFRRSGARLTLVSAVPAPGWRVEVEQAAGAEIEVDFRQGSRRVQVNLELEDGVVRERIRIRDEVDGTDILIENGVVVRTEPGDRADDRVDDERVDDDRVGDDNRGPGGDDAVDDNSNSGPGSGGDHPVDGNSNSGPGSGHGADDPAGDDHGGHRGSDG